MALVQWCPWPTSGVSPQPAPPGCWHRVWHASAHQSGHRSPGTRRGMAGGGATMAEVGRGGALEHPQWRGHPLDKWVKAAAHPSFLPMGMAEKPGWWRRSPTRWVLQWPAWSCIGVGRKRELRRRCTKRQRRQGGARGSAHHGGG
jgi:hypothetical protein